MGTTLGAGAGAVGIFDAMDSIVMNFAPSVEMTLLNSVLATNMSAVGVATSPG